MATVEEDTVDAEKQIRDLAGNLRSHRQRACLLFVSRSIQGSDLRAVRHALGDEAGEHLDVIVSSPGGDVGAAYLVTRQLRGRFEHLAVFVPLRAKSAATLLCLAGDELVLGSLGELGPLDQQYEPEENWTRAREVHPGVLGAREGRKVLIELDGRQFYWSRTGWSFSCENR